jgi:hypothetical protein
VVGDAVEAVAEKRMPAEPAERAHSTACVFAGGLGLVGAGHETSSPAEP